MKPQTKRPERVRAAGALGNTVKIRHSDRIPTAEEFQRADAAIAAIARLLAHDIEAELAAGGAT